MCWSRDSCLYMCSKCTNNICVWFLELAGAPVQLEGGQASEGVKVVKIEVGIELNKIELS